MSYLDDHEEVSEGGGSLPENIVARDDDDEEDDDDEDDDDDDEEEGDDEEEDEEDVLDRRARIERAHWMVHFIYTIKNDGTLAPTVNNGDMEISLLHQFFDQSNDASRVSLLWMSVEHGHASLALFLLERGTPIDPLPGCTEEENPLFHVACSYNSVEVVQAFIKRGALVQHKDKKGRTPLHYAVDGGNWDVVMLLARHKAPVNEMDNEGCTPLHKAAAKSTVEMVKLLLALGADWHAGRTLTPLHLACDSGRIDLVKLFLEDGGDWQVSSHTVTPFHSACQAGHLGLVQLFLQYGATVNLKDIDGNTPLHLCCLNAGNGLQLGLAKWLLDHGAAVDETDRNGQTPLFYACQKDEDLTCLLLSRGANVNWKRVDGKTPLHMALSLYDAEDIPSPSVSTVRLLIAHGAVVNDRDKNGVTPLQLAFYDRDTVELLLQIGAEVNSANYYGGLTPLHMACAYNSDSFVAAMLVRAGAQLNARDRNGATPLYRACQNGPFETVQFLLGAGADWSIPTHNGETALHAAAYRVNLDMVKALLDAGAVANISDQRERTPLHQLAETDSDCAEIGRLLLKAGAPAEKADVEGRTALQLASDRGLVELAQVLLQHVSAKQETNCIERKRKVGNV